MRRVHRGRENDTQIGLLANHLPQQGQEHQRLRLLEVKVAGKTSMRHTINSVRHLPENTGTTWKQDEEENTTVATKN